MSVTMPIFSCDASTDAPALGAVEADADADSDGSLLALPLGASDADGAALWLAAGALADGLVAPVFVHAAIAISIATSTTRARVRTRDSSSHRALPRRDDGDRGASTAAMSPAGR
jgi:hypothetical protein